MISLVIPAFEDGAALRENLPRHARLRGGKELIVADGGGNDDAREVARSVGARWVVARTGRGPQMNAGAAAASGELLLFLHADCWLDDDALEQADRALADRAVGAAIFSQRIGGERLAYRLIERAASARARWLRRPYGDSGLCVRREDFARIGGFPELPVCEDLAMGPRVARLGRLVVLVARVHVSARRWERHGVLATTLLNWKVLGAFLAGVAPERLYSMYYGRPLGNGGLARDGGWGSGEAGMEPFERGDARGAGR